MPAAETHPWSGGGSVRFTRYLSEVTAPPMQGGQGMSPGPAPGTTTTVGAQLLESWAYTGPYRHRWGITAHAAGIADSTGGATIAGLVGQLLVLGDLRVEGSDSFYDPLYYYDPTVWRAAAAWRLPLGHAWFAPMGAVQRVGDTWLGSGALGAGYDADRWFLRAGASAGRQNRPALLGLSLVYDVPETITAGAWGGGSLALGQRDRLFLGAEGYRSEEQSSTNPDVEVGTTYSSLTATLGAQHSFGWGRAPPSVARRSSPSDGRGVDDD